MPASITTDTGAGLSFDLDGAEVADRPHPFGLQGREILAEGPVEGVEVGLGALARPRRPQEVQECEEFGGPLPAEVVHEGPCLRVTHAIVAAPQAIIPDERAEAVGDLRRL